MAVCEFPEEKCAAIERDHFGMLLTVGRLYHSPVVEKQHIYGLNCYKRGPPLVRNLMDVSDSPKKLALEFRQHDWNYQIHSMDSDCISC